MFDSLNIPNVPYISEMRYCKGCQEWHEVHEFNTPFKLFNRGRVEVFCKGYKKMLKLKRDRNRNLFK